MSIEQYDEFTNEIRGLLTKWLSDGVTIMMRLREFELAGTWTVRGHRHFRDYLTAEFPNALGFGKYDLVVKALDIHGEKKVRQLGIESVGAITTQQLIESPEAMRRFDRMIDIHVEQNGVPPDTEKVRKLVKEAAQIAPVTKEGRTLSKLEKLEQENAELKRQLKLKDKRIRELEKQLGLSSEPLSTEN